MRIIVFTFSLFLLFILSLQNAPADSKSSNIEVFKLEGVLSGKDIHYERYREFEEKYYYRGTEDSFEPLKDFRADSRGGEVKFYDSIPEKGLCGALFKWKFDRDMVEIEAGEEVGITLSYDIIKKECVESMAQGWIALTINDPYYEQFLGNDLDEKVKEGLPAGSDIFHGLQVGAVVLEAGRANVSAESKLKFPVSIDPGTYLTLRLTIFRYYFPNTPVAVYLFKAE